jgi:hypothetical protein
MSLSHRHGWPTAEDAERSKVYLTNPGAVIVTDCRFCDKVHVDVPDADSAPKRVMAVRKAPRNTGPSRLVREAVMARDSFRCCGCGVGIIGRDWSMQHRVARGAGGTSREDANATCNLIVLCGSATSPGCHRRAEDRDPVMHERGLWLNSWQNPFTEPVIVTAGHCLLKLWLTDDAEYSLVQPEVAA